jgi:glucokinase
VEEILASIGIDVGGTKTAALVWNDGDIEARSRIPTDTRSSDTVLQGIIKVCQRVKGEADTKGLVIEAIGVGIAGFIDQAEGVVTDSPNLPLRHFRLRELLSQACGLPVFIDNDANAAALAEAVLGAGKGACCLVHLTLGTGIGGGIVLDGRIFRGSSGSPMEVGHMVIHDKGPLCTCGSRGCLEALASGTAIYNRIRELSISGVDSPLIDEFLRDPQAFDAKTVGRYADRGERTALRILEDAGRSLGIGIGNLVNLINPDMVTLSGGLLNSFAHMEEAMLSAAEEISITANHAKVRIRKGILERDTGRLGAALLPALEPIGGESARQGRQGMMRPAGQDEERKGAGDGLHR